MIMPVVPVVIILLVTMVTMMARSWGNTTQGIIKTALEY